MLYYSLKAFEESSVDDIILVTGKDEIEYCEEKIIKQYNFSKIKTVVQGGAQRYHSVFQGLQKVEGAQYVLIHDGARPFVTKEMIERTITEVKKFQACAVGVPAKDTIKIVDDKMFSIDTPKRDNVWMVQTPQAFAYPLIYEAYEKIMKQEDDEFIKFITDDTMVVEKMCNIKVKLIKGSYENMKITVPSDLKIAELFCLKK